MLAVSWLNSQIVFDGIVQGLAVSVIAVGVVLVYRGTRIINFAVGDYGTANWMFDVEKLVKRIDPVLARARMLIHASRFEIPGMQNAKGVVEKKGLKDKIFDKIDDWMENPQKPPKVDKSRIVGFGSDSLPANLKT